MRCLLCDLLLCCVLFRSLKHLEHTSKYRYAMARRLACRGFSCAGWLLLGLGSGCSPGSILTGSRRLEGELLRPCGVMRPGQATQAMSLAQRHTPRLNSEQRLRKVGDPRNWPTAFRFYMIANAQQAQLQYINTRISERCIYISRHGCSLVCVSCFVCVCFCLHETGTDPANNHCVLC